MQFIRDLYDRKYTYLEAGIIISIFTFALTLFVALV